MSKLTQAQKEQLKQCVIDSSIRLLTTIETQQYIHDKMNGLDIMIDYIRHLKSDLKKESEKQLNLYHKDRFAYMNEAFFDRIEELRSMQKTLHEIIDNFEQDPKIRIKAINQLQSITVLLTNYYERLPGMSKLGGIDFDGSIISALNNNNPTTTVAASRQNHDVSEYLEWCKNNNPRHPDNCNCHWDEYQA